MHWVKQVLIGKGISEDRIAIAVGSGELYPVCRGSGNHECWVSNNLICYLPSTN